MSKLPVVSGQEAVRALKKIGYLIDHQTGSHIILRQSPPPHRRLSVPQHTELAKGTLRSIIRQAGLTVEEFSALL
ncbi:type II toxin-antitoxin system HicA family toxin [Nitrospira sp. BLG_2]|uniref:type II toxin-antitoxin system HicA family toxin n=1 Tax=Nitrospira sp. BLG_2 TaxID=3397507 RepID=UPI003B9BEFDD